MSTKEYGVVEGGVPSELVEQVYKEFAGDLDWYFLDSIDSKTTSDTYFQFIHQIYNDKSGAISKHANLIRQFIPHFEKASGKKVVGVVRVKANLLSRSNVIKKEEWAKTWHVDIHVPEHDMRKFMSVVYYVMDSDGDTVLFNKADTTKVLAKSSPKKGNFFWFDSSWMHSASPPKKNKRRVIINFIFEVLPT